MRSPQLKTEPTTLKGLDTVPVGGAMPAVLRLGVALAASLVALSTAAQEREQVDCQALSATLRSADDSDVSPAERQRLSEILFSACARTDLKLMRATTLDGAPVLELRGPAFSAEGRAP